MRRSALFLLVLVALLLLGVSPALAAPQQALHQERRIALVIGNGAYPTAPLKNPVNDARDMAAALRGLGFDVIARENVSLSQMEGAVGEFWARLKKGGAGLFYYAGHGLQVNGRNYLVPVDARLETEQDAKYKCMDAGLVLGRMEDAGNGLNLVILDACRNNPFARSWRSADVGLAKMDAPKGSLIAYATAPDSVAADGEGKNGLYTEKLLRAMRAPGQPVEQMFKRVRDEVMRATRDKQVPWESTSLRGDFYFSPGAGGPAPAMAVAPATAPTAAPSVPAQLSMASAPQQAPPSAEHKAGDTWRDPVTGMEFMWVPGGEYEMGCGPWSGGFGLWVKTCAARELPIHTVHVDGFWLGKTEVTQGQWQKIMGSNPAHFKRGDNYPVEQVSWNDAKEYISRLNTNSSSRFRLPTEAEWEYAARSGGRTEKYAGGDDLFNFAWFDGNSGRSTHMAGTKAPNGLGLYDMSGNVWEWCEDVYDSKAYVSHSHDNPLNRGSGSVHVLRGGSISDLAGSVRTVSRSISSIGFQTFIGFRLVREP